MRRVMMDMRRYGKMFSLAMFLAVFLLSAPPAEAIFKEESKALPGIIVGEVACYKDNPVKKDICNSYWALLKTEIRESKKLRLVSLPDVVMPTSFEASTEAEEKAIADYHAGVARWEFLSKAHMDAILRGDESALLDAGEKLSAYSKSVGRTIVSTANPYPVSTSLREPLRRLGEENGARYILFCHLIGIRGGAVIGFLNFGNKVTGQVDYYLIDTLEGKIYRTHKERSKSARTQSLLAFGEVGKEMPTEMLLQRIMEKGAQEFIKDLEKQCGGKNNEEN